MKNQFVKTFTLLLLLCSANTFAQSCEINGSWKHSQKPASLLIDISKQQITVERHQLNPDTAGLTVIQELQTDKTKENLWSGKMYAATSDSFIPVKITALNCHTLVVTENMKEILRLLRD
ncbi:hypothetical protein tinsulaeT_17130 [Thalassotalea insulae]|uniref:Uncharacterized protein n=1 Tax=Thalassotalea insulae TaxID=2056778 RepID=A0ABQ6GQY8_9GAMM|nr:hypothetical protein [Thalassotalea insulae]GLX78373.1 hypothetical protein tinsulaeT_17130 [Thalassotalea insulae]